MNENDSLNQTNLNEEITNDTTDTQEYQTPDTNTTSNEPVKHHKIIEAMIKASDNPEKSREEWDELAREGNEVKEDFKNMKKDFDKMADETNKNYEKAKPKSFMENVIHFFFLLFAITIVVGLFRSCVGNTPENRAIKNAQNLIFEDYGGSNFDVYVDTSLEDVKWDAEKLGKDRWAVYMTGYSPEYDIQLMTQITLAYGDDDTYTGEVNYVEYDGVGYSDYDSIRYALAIIYDTVNQEFVSDYMGYLLGF